MHIVQLSYDDSVLTDPEGESLRRQSQYARVLDQLQPGSVLSLVVLTQRTGLPNRYLGQLHLVTFSARRERWRKLWAWSRLFGLLTRLDRQLRIDALTTQTVHDEAWVALLFGRLRGRPVVGQIHTDIFNDHLRRAGPLRRFGVVRYRAINLLLPLFSAVRVVGKSLARNVKQRAPRIPVSVLPVAMPIVDQSWTAVEAVQPPVVLFVGRLVPVKNLNMWLAVVGRLLHEVPDAQFEIVGAGPELCALRERAAELGLEGRLSFVGFVENTSLPARYGRASVFLLTSFYEGFGRAVVEALAHGVPVVAPRITGVEDIVDDGETGFLVDGMDIAAFAARVRWLLEHPDQRREFGARGISRMRARYGMGQLSNDWMAFLVETAQGGKRA